MTFPKLAFSAGAALALANLALAPLANAHRLPLPAAASMTAAQKQAAAEMQKGPFGVGGPFIALLRDPTLATEAYRIATYYRNQSVLGDRLTELVVLMAARNWAQQFEWNAHQPRALKSGLKQETVDAIREGRRPMSLSADEQIVYDFITELNQNKSVSNATYARALKQFGERGVVNLTALNGYYAMLAMVLNVAQTPVPNVQGPPLPALPR
jgi:4-carboxymuconolactone decarboxylase